MNVQPEDQFNKTTTAAAGSAWVFLVSCPGLVLIIDDAKTAMPPANYERRVESEDDNATEVRVPHRVEENQEIAPTDAWRIGTIRVWLDGLLMARVHEIKRLCDSIIRIGTPKLISDAAIRQFQITGREDYLVSAAALLENYGRLAWPVLYSLAFDRRLPTASLVSVIARCPGVPESERAEALRVLAAHPDGDVRYRVLDHVSSFDAVNRSSVVKALSNADDEVAEYARDLLDAL